MTRRRERGSVVIEAAVGVPAFVLFIAMIIAAGRVAMAHQAVDAAAADSARAASIARSQPAARDSAETAAAASLADQSLQCSSTSVDVDTAGFTAPVGTPARITASLSCVVALADVALPGLPGHLTVTASMSSPIDTYRERDSRQ